MVTAEESEDVQGLTLNIVQPDLRAQGRPDKPVRVKINVELVTLACIGVLLQPTSASRCENCMCAWGGGGLSPQAP